MSELSKEVLAKAKAQANDMGHALLTLEHLALALLKEDQATQHILMENNVDYRDIVTTLTEYLQNHAKIKKGTIVEDIDPAVNKALTIADARAREVYGDFIARGPQILYGIVMEKDSYVAGVLDKSYGLDEETYTGLVLRDFEKNGARPPSAGPSDVKGPLAAYIDQSRRAKPERNTFIVDSKKLKTLSAFSVNLNEQAVKDKIDPVIGREAEIDRAIQILARRTKNNPVFLGEGGVGKSAIVEGIARRIVEGSVPEFLKNKNIVTLDLAAMVAGTKFRGEFEERMKAVIKELKENKENVIVFLDELHTLVGAGSAEGALDASNILKPALARGEINTIGATTLDEYRKYIEKDKALARRFQTVLVDEPSPAETKEIVRGLKDRYGKFHGVSFSDEILDAIVDMSVRFITERVLPDKAIDVMDEIGASLKVHRGEFDDVPTPATMKDVESAVALISRRPVGSVSAEDAEELEELENKLKKRVKGQDPAIAAIADAVIKGRSGLKNPDTPIGSFIFDGKTGVGKTELCKALAEALFTDEKAIVRIDMSEYMEKHNVARLVGAPPGYVGYEEGGKLTEAVRQHPYSVILLDEIEKAHPDVFNILLQVLSDGRLTDSHGRTVDFKNTIVVMTTNAGAREKNRGGSGFANDDGSSQRSKALQAKDNVPAAIKKIFTPEFLNRVGARNVISFNDLQLEHMLSIVDKFMAVTQKQLEEKKVTMTVTPAAREYLAREGYDPDMGARPLDQLIDDEIRTPLSREVAFKKGQLRNGGTVDIDVDLKENKLTFEYNRAAKGETPANDNVPAPVLALPAPVPAMAP